MSKVKVTIKHTQTATFDTGDIPVNLIRDLLAENDGTLDGNFTLGDIGDEWIVDEIDVEEVK